MKPALRIQLFAQVPEQRTGDLFGDIRAHDLPETIECDHPELTPPQLAFDGSETRLCVKCGEPVHAS